MSIVVGYDESPGAGRALATAIELAQRFAEPLILVYGVAPPGGHGEEFRAHQEALQELGRAATEHAVERSEAAGVETQVAVVNARPAEALVDAADQHDARLIVVGTWGESPLRGAVLGSTPHRLLHISSRPVVVVPE